MFRFLALGLTLLLCACASSPSTQSTPSEEAAPAPVQTAGVTDPWADEPPPAETAPDDAPVADAAVADDAEPDDGTFDARSLYEEADAFFGAGAAGLADVLNRTFSEKGRPNAFIKGEEAGGAVAVGVRYGRGVLEMKDGTTRQVYWRGPSIGLELGGSAAKVFILVYDLPEADDIYRRFSGVEGSLYFVGGVGATYNNAGDIGIAPIRVGVGWRQGVTFGYMQFTEEAGWNPF